MRHAFALFALVITIMACEAPTTDMSKVDDTFTNQLAASKTKYEEYVFGQGYTAKDLILVIMDCSLSMDGSRIVEAKKSLTMFFEKIKEDQPVALYIFDGHGPHWALEPNVYPKDQLTKAVSELEASGSTPLGSAMKEVLNKAKEFKGGNKYEHYTVLVITDGEVDSGEYSLMQDMAMNTIREGFYLDVIGYEMSHEHTLNKFASRYRNASETTLQTTLLEALPETTK